MSFNSWQFLVFLPIVIVGYYLLPRKVKWIWLLLASYYFYMSWNPWLVFLIAGTTLVSYLSAILMEKTSKPAVKKAWLILTLVVCLGVLIFFKYFNFLMQSAIDFLNLFALHLDDITLDLILPIGISFYTFQTLSYVVDVYRGKYPAERHLGYYALFVSFFPQLVAGPIEKPDSLIPQLKAYHPLEKDNILAGTRMLISGFFRKVVLADFCGILVNNVFNNLEKSNSFAIFLASALFLLEIYFDFSGYSEIALGASRLMGIRLTTNFDRPFLSQNYSEFFRRWHITLNSWFRDYLYIPLGGNRKGMPRKILNIWIVFLLCGLWHGANWTYVLWGANAAFFISLEVLLHKPFLAFCQRHGIDLSKPSIRLFRCSYMFLIYTFSVILFRAKDLAQVGLAYQRLFTAFSGNFFSDAMTSLQMNAFTILFLVLALLCMAGLYSFCYSTPPSELILPKPTATAAIAVSPTQERSLFVQKASVYAFAILAIALCWLSLLSTHGESAFAYFQF